MKSQNFLFLTFCLVLVMGLMQSFFFFKDYFSPIKAYQHKISTMHLKLEKEKLRSAQFRNQVFDFQQEVAATLPALNKISPIPENFQLRSLASVTQKPLNAFEMSGALSEKARAEFRRKEYIQAAHTFELLTQKYPTSPKVIQAYFFWAESLFMSNQAQDCLDVIDVMITQFPDADLTGFIMLRMGQILEVKSRSEEAKEVYRTVAVKFAGNHELMSQAEKLYKGIN
jgi:TolA-binding protein